MLVLQVSRPGQKKLTQASIFCSKFVTLITYGMGTENYLIGDGIVI